jgi:hypothetical protein
MPPFKAPGDADPKSYFGTPGNHGSIFFFLTPFMQESDVYDGGAFTNATGQKAHDVDATTGTGKVARPPAAPFCGQEQLLVLHCPLDPTMPSDGVIRADPESYSTRQPWGACSYACNYLAFGNASAIEHKQIDNPDLYDARANPPHVAPATCPRIPLSFLDGLPNTILFTEKLAECQWTRAGSAAPEAGGNLWGPSVDTAQWAPAFAMESPWHDGTKFQLRPSSIQCNVAYPSSGHPDRLPVAMADASVRQVRLQISIEIFYSLCTPSGGEIFGPGDY